MSDTQPHMRELAGTAPAWFDAQAGLARLDRGLTAPTIREHWKYTPIQPFVTALVEAAHTNGPAPEIQGAGQRGVSVSPLSELAAGQADTVAAMAGEIDPARYPLADLALLNGGAGTFCHITESPPRPLILNPGTHANQAMFVHVAAGAEVELQESSPEGPGNGQLIVVRVEPGGRVRHARCALDPQAAHYSLVFAILGDDAAYALNQYHFGGRQRRSDCHFVLAGPGATVNVTAAFLADEGSHIDQQFVVEHRSRDTVSRQKVHGIVTGRSRSVYNGRIHIHEGASASDAALTNRNLSLHPQAEIDTKPELEIYTDDVRCAHGATVGQLSEDSLFYLRSRGVPEAQARVLLCNGFLRECVDGPFADAVAARIREALQ
jgi:Fe-S cluster assembly protein SufD